MGKLVVAELKPDAPSPLYDLIVILQARGLNASTKIYNYHYAHGTQGFTSLFEDLAKNWRGWAGDKRWESIEGDLKLSCSSDSVGHIEILIELSSVVSNPVDGWDVRGTLVVEAGQLESIAMDVKRFFQS